MSGNKFWSFCLLFCQLSSPSVKCIKHFGNRAQASWILCCVVSKKDGRCCENVRLGFQFPLIQLLVGDFTKGIQWPQQGVFEGGWPFFQDAVFNAVGCIRADQADWVIWGYLMPPCWFLGLCQAQRVGKHSASAGVALGRLSSTTNIVLVQEGASLDVFRVKQTVGFWITSYGIYSYLLYKCGIAPPFSSLWSSLYGRLLIGWSLITLLLHTSMMWG